MQIKKEDIEKINKQRDNLKISSTLEFSFIAFYDKITGEFEDFSIVNSISDNSVHTTLDLTTEEMLYVLDKMEQNPNLAQVWGHSHNNMGVSPSGQDLQTMEELGHGGVGVIINNRMNYTIMMNIHGTVFTETFNEHVTPTFQNYGTSYWSNRTWNPTTRRWEVNKPKESTIAEGIVKSGSSYKYSKNKKKHNDYSWYDDFYYPETHDVDDYYDNRYDNDYNIPDIKKNITEMTDDELAEYLDIEEGVHFEEIPLEIGDEYNG